ncbi:MAG: hypothetical protein RIQ93_3110, partial [Verrucomicrobiota bacterium]
MRKEELLPTRAEFTVSQKALLAERLQRARVATSRSAQTRPTIPQRKGSGPVPLSFAQERLWFLDQLEPGSAVYNVCQGVRLRGPLNTTALEQTLQSIIQRHEVLRTNFIATDGAPVQVVAPAALVPLATADLTVWDGGDPELELQRLLQEEARRPFDLAGDLLIRAFLVRVVENEHVLLLTTHHIISDGWSVGVIFREVAALYGAFCMGQEPSVPELPVQFGDYVLWEREQMQGAALERPLAYWKKQLGGKLPPLELPCDYSRAAARMSHGATQHLLLPRALTQAIKALGQQEGATLFMTLLASFQVLLYRWTGQEDVVVGSVVAGRRKVELEPLIGLFVNTLVFRSDLSGEPSFRQFLVGVREMSLAALANQDLPFDRLVQELRPDRNLSRNPLFQVMFVFQNAPMSPAELPGLSLEPIEVDTGTAKFELSLSMAETPRGLQASLEYNADLFERSTVVRLLESFHTLLKGIAAEPDQRVSRFPLLSAAERQHMLSTFNGATINYPRDQTIAELFAEQAELAPHAVAVKLSAAHLTYGELERRANQLAHRLRREGVGAETLVTVCLERSLELIVVLLAI